MSARLWQSIPKTLLSHSKTNSTNTAMNKFVSKRLSILPLLALCIPIVLLCASCKAKKTTTTSTHVEVQQYTDTTKLIHIRLAELVALETLRTWNQGDTAVVVRSFKVATRTADTTEQASSQQLATNSAEKTETITEPPLMAERKKKGVAWLCPIACIVVLIILGIIYVFWRCVKN